MSYIAKTNIPSSTYAGLPAAPTGNLRYKLTDQQKNFWYYDMVSSRWKPEYNNEYVVTNFGAVADAVSATISTLAANTSTLVATASVFSASDVGKVIYINRGGLNATTDAFEMHKTTIQSYTSPTTVVLTAAVLNYNCAGQGFWFGTDNTTAFNDAITAANAAGGGTVKIPRGSYIVTKVNMKARVRIVGEGRDASNVLSAASSSAIISASYTVNSSNDACNVVEHFTINGINAWGFAAGYEDICGSNSVINNMGFRGTHHGAVLDQTELTDVHHCLFETFSPSYWNFGDYPGTDPTNMWPSRAIAVGSITSGTNTFNCVGGAYFIAADAGRKVTVYGAGVAGGNLVTTISTVAGDGNSCTLAANASTTVAGTSYPAGWMIGDRWIKKGSGTFTYDAFYTQIAVGASNDCYLRRHIASGIFREKGFTIVITSPTVNSGGGNDSAMLRVDDGYNKYEIQWNSTQARLNGGTWRTCGAGNIVMLRINPGGKTADFFSAVSSTLTPTETGTASLTTGGDPYIAWGDFSTTNQSDVYWRRMWYVPCKTIPTCLWLVDGAEWTPGNSAGFTNRIAATYNQFNGGACELADDGGYPHYFAHNNFNGSLWHASFVGQTATSLEDSEFEGNIFDSITIGARGIQRAYNIGNNLGITIKKNLLTWPTDHYAVWIEQGSGVNIVDNYFPHSTGYACYVSALAGVNNLTFKGNVTQGGAVFDSTIFNYGYPYIYSDQNMEGTGESFITKIKTKGIRLWPDRDLSNAVTSSSNIKFYDDDLSNSIKVVGQSALSSDYTITLPAATGTMMITPSITNGQVWYAASGAFAQSSNLLFNGTYLKTSAITIASTNDPSGVLDVYGTTIHRGNVGFIADATYDIGPGNDSRPRYIYATNDIVTASGKMMAHTVQTHDESAGIGYMAMNYGGANASGYLGWYTKTGSRLGYMGYGSATGTPANDYIELTLENCNHLRIHGWRLMTATSLLYPATDNSADIGQAGLRVKTLHAVSANFGHSSLVQTLTVNQASNATAATATTYTLGVHNNGTVNFAIGSDATYVYLQSWASKPLYLNSQGNSIYVGSHVLFGTDNTYDIGATGGATRPRYVYAGTRLEAPKAQLTYNQSLTFPSIGNGAYGAVHIIPATNTNDYSTAVTFGSPDAGGGVRNDVQAGIFVQGSGVYGTRMYFATSNSWGSGAQARFHITEAGHLLATTDNSYDIGASGATRPRTVYVGTGINTPAISNLTTNGVITTTSGTGTLSVVAGIVGGGSGMLTYTPQADANIPIWIRARATQSGNLFFIGSSADAGYVTVGPTGNLALGNGYGSTPPLKFQVTGGGSQQSTVNVGFDSSRYGMFLGSGAYSHGEVLAGCEYTGAAYTARTNVNAASSIYMYNGTFEVRTDTGLTDGNTFTPTTRLYIAGSTYRLNSLTSNGVLTTTSSNGTLAVVSAVPVSQGGTGLSTLTAHSIQIGNGTSNVTQLAVGASGTLLQGVASSDPTFTATPTLGVVSSVTGQLKLANSGSAYLVILQAGVTTTSDRTFTWPVDYGTNGYVLSTNGSGVLSWIANGSGSGATAALDNLASVNINTSLLAQTGVDLGSTTKPFRDLYLWGTGTYATTYLKLTGAPTSTRTITFPDATGTVGLLGINQTFTGIQTFSPTARSSGNASYLTINIPADTNQTASNEAIGINHIAATRQWATGALTTQREVVFGAPTYGFVGASTLTTAINVDIANPIQGTNATLTNIYSLRAADVLFTGIVKAGSGPTTLTDSAGKILSTALNTVGGTQGGTGVNNGSFTITLAGNLVTTGAYNTTFAAGGTATHTLPTTSSTLARTDAGQTFTGVQVFTSPKIITQISDTNGNILVNIGATGSAVNYVKITNAATGTAGPILAADGETNVDLKIAAKGTGSIHRTSGVYGDITAYSPSAAGTATLTLNTGNIHTITMPAGNITIALSNVQVGQSFIINIIQDGTGSRTVTWFSTLKWASGSAPTLTTTANKIDTFGFICTSSGNYQGYIVGQNL